MENQGNVAGENNGSGIFDGALPTRVLIYENGQWNDVPLPVLMLVRDHFQAKIADVEILSDEGHFILDLSRLTIVNCKTGESMPMGWIDEIGQGLFPPFP